MFLKYKEKKKLLRCKYFFIYLVRKYFFSVAEIGARGVKIYYANL